MVSSVQVKVQARVRICSFGISKISVDFSTPRRNDYRYGTSNTMSSCFLKIPGTKEVERLKNESFRWITSLILLGEDVFPLLSSPIALADVIAILSQLRIPLRRLSTTIVVCPSIFLLSGEDSGPLFFFEDHRFPYYISSSSLSGASPARKTTDRTVSHVLVPRYTHA